MNIAICEDNAVQRNQLVQGIKIWEAKQMAEGGCPEVTLNTGGTPGGIGLAHTGGTPGGIGLARTGGSTNPAGSPRSSTHIKPQIHRFSDAASFLLHAKKHAPFDLLFLDIDLGGNSAQETAKSFQNTNAAMTQGSFQNTNIKRSPTNGDSTRAIATHGDSRATHGDSVRAIATHEDSRATHGDSNWAIATHEDNNTAHPFLTPPNDDGLRIAAQIRRQDKEAIIVFTTSNVGYVFDGYKVQAFDFLVKPLRQSEIERVLDFASRHMRNKSDQIFLADTNTGIKRVAIADICYFEAQLQFVELHTVDGVEVFRARFNDIIEQMLPRGFVVPHRSYLVNLAHIECLSKSSLLMRDKRKIPISRNRQKEMTAAWLEFAGCAPEVENA
ncbi:MAG: LytTR family DNA-binding domain-containing protein [Coriobacteriaceae bacterium]|jgi:DNA-binding LytR/AlgR family response regulator|nr:LytTR family DNA-binding domain-containing protein [Coriobacteriaceae bacterium]